MFTQCQSDDCFFIIIIRTSVLPSLPGPWKIGIRSPPGRCLGRAQKYRPHVCPRRDEGCPKGCRGQGCGWRPYPSGGRLGPPASSRKGDAQLGRGLGHALARLANSSRVYGAGPTPYDQPDPRRSATGSPERQRRDPPTGITHLRRLRARTQLCPPQTPAPASPAAADRGRGRRLSSANQELPPGARGQYAPRLNRSGGSDGNIPEGSLRLVRLFQTPPHSNALDFSAPPKPLRAVPPQGCGGGAATGSWPIEGKEGDKRPMGSWGLWTPCSKLGVWMRVLGGEPRSGAGPGSHVTEAEFWGEKANSQRPEKRTL